MPVIDKTTFTTFLQTPHRSWAKKVRPKDRTLLDDGWDAIRGLWKGHKINPVAFQRRLRREPASRV